MITPMPGGLRYKGKYCRFVESDVYNVVNRIKEIDPRLYVVLHEGEKRPWVVMEQCADGEVRFVTRYEELSPKILDDLRHMLAVPFQARIDAMQKKLDEENDAAKKHRESDAWQQFTWDFNRTLHEANMVDSKYYKSLPFDGKRRKRGGV